jgi:dimethylhistidine N-methyltransferase
MKNAISLSQSMVQPSYDDGFLYEAIEGLSRPQKTLPCKFLYDEAGSRLFDEICELEEYYPTRTEDQILRDNIFEIAGLIGQECRLAEFGSGSSTKTRHLLTHLPNMAGYVPIDISGPQLLKSAARLANEFPGIEIKPLEADYGEISELPNTSRKPRRTVAFFPGSTIGNFDPAAAVAFLRNIARLCGIEGGLLIGVDRKTVWSQLQMFTVPPANGSLDAVPPTEALASTSNERRTRYRERPLIGCRTIVVAVVELPRISE